MGQYYLHTNGSLIYKPRGGIGTNCSFVKRVWETADFTTPQAFMQFLKEAVSSGANQAGVDFLIRYNNLDQFIPDCREQIYA